MRDALSTMPPQHNAVVSRHTCHVCLVSQQAAPNFIPVLDSRFRPQRVILVVSPDMRERAAWLESALKQRGLQVDQYPIQDAWSVPQIQAELLQLLIKEEGTDLALNVTGGTKPMAIAAQSVFDSEKRPIFYVHPERDEVIPLFRNEAPFRIEQRVQIPDYLSIHGFRQIDRDTRVFPKECYLLGSEWVKEVGRLAKWLGKLNYLAAQCASKLRCAVPAPDKDRPLWEMIDKLCEHGLATLDKSEIVFPDEKARFFANGGWLELYVDDVINNNKAALGIQDSARNLKVESSGNARNELDIAVLAKNRLYLVECKTRKMGDAEDGTPGTETLYKLDSLTSLGGLNTRGMVVSYQTLNRWDKQRAKDMRIQVIEGGQLRNLAQHLQDWMR